MGTMATCGRIIEHGIYHSKKPCDETSLPASDMQSQCKSRTTFQGRGGEGNEREKRGKCLLPSNQENQYKQAYPFQYKVKTRILKCPYIYDLHLNKK